MKIASGLALALAVASVVCLAEGAPSQPALCMPETGLSCGSGRVVLESQDGRPACVTTGTAQKLLDRGWREAASTGSAAVRAGPAETITVQPNPWTAYEKSERAVSEITDGRPYTPCYLPSPISVQVPAEAAVGRPFDVTITPSFEMTPQQLRDYNDLYETDFESARDMWESVCDPDLASFKIMTPATYKPSGDGVSHVWTASSLSHYPTFNYYYYEIDRKFEFGSGTTTVQMTIDEPIIFRMSDIDDRGNQDYYKFDFGYFWVYANTVPLSIPGPPRTLVYTDIKDNCVRFSDSEFLRE